jgi:hypothetical protein
MSRGEDVIPNPPGLADLMANYLRRQTTAHTHGLAAVDPSGEVVPFDAAPADPVEPRLAWNGATAALAHFKLSVGTDVPPDWAVLVAAHEPEAAPALAVGNFPQLVRHLNPLLRADRLADLLPTDARLPSHPAVVEWARKAVRAKSPASALVAVGVLRLARQFDAAAELLRARRPGDDAAWSNEEAALAWHRGHVDEAGELWSRQAESTPVVFNRGLAALFADRPAEARSWLVRAEAQLSEDSPWRHLAGLYRTLAEIRGA